VQYREGYWYVVGSNKTDVYLSPADNPEHVGTVPGVHKVVVSKDGSRRPWLDAMGNVYREGAFSRFSVKVPRADILAAIPWVAKPMRVKGSTHGARTGDVAGRPVYGNAVDAFEAFISHVVNLRHTPGETFSRCARCAGDACPSMRGRFSQRPDGRWELSKYGRCPATFDGPSKASQKHSKRCVAPRVAEVLVGRNPARHR
jgi:hypothetical protein